MIKQMSIAVAGAAVLAFMATCGAGNPTPTLTPRPAAATPTPTTAPPAAIPTENALDSAQAALLQGQERWERSGITDYAYTGAWTCFCPEEYRADTQVTVGGGKVTAVNSAAPNAGTIPAPERFVPIEGLFALILDAITQHAAYIEVSYDETYGYPVELFIDYNERMADEEDRFTISSFTPR